MVKTSKSSTSTPATTSRDPEPEITSSVKPNSEFEKSKSQPVIQPLMEEWNTLQASNTIAPPNSIHDHFRSMGMALFHIGSATLQYELIKDGFPIRKFGNTREELTQRYLSAEVDARSAQVLLYHAVELGYEDEEFKLGPEVKKYCRMAKIWLTEKRQEAAIKMGIDPPPMIDEDVQTDQLDYNYVPEDRAPE